MFRPLQKNAFLRYLPFPDAYDFDRCFRVDFCDVRNQIVAEGVAGADGIAVILALIIIVRHSAYGNHPFIRQDRLILNRLREFDQIAASVSSAGVSIDKVRFR